MIYAIGDIHGYCAKLEHLLLKLKNHGMTDDDTLVFMGDYVDRGPDTAGVIDFLIELQAHRPRTVFLRGNHEQMMLDARQKFDPNFDSDNPVGNCDLGMHWFPNGGVETLRSYGQLNGRHWTEIIPESHWNFVLNTQLEYEEDQYLFVHAGIVPPDLYWRFGVYDADPRLWIRDEFIRSRSDFGGRVVVYGHTPSSSGLPVIQANKLGIDTGAGFGGPLTAVGLKSKYDPRDLLIIQVK